MTRTDSVCPADLLIAPCSREAATHAVTHWHYSHRMPSGRIHSYGVWENNRFIGAVVFGRGANDRMLLPFGLKQSDGCELVRVALREHTAPVSQIVAAALRQVKQDNPGLRVVVSYADPVHGHHGGIYQAGGWFYLGVGSEQTEWRFLGKQKHSRSVSAMLMSVRGTEKERLEGESTLAWLRRVYDPKAVSVRVPPKHRYVMPLDKQMRRLLSKQAQPYPPRAVQGSMVILPSSGGQSGFDSREPLQAESS